MSAPTMRWRRSRSESGRWVGKTWSWAMTMVSSLCQPPAVDLFRVAETIRDTERRQAERIRAGVSLRRQLQFDRYLA
jgi:hypothetical protein